MVGKGQGILPSQSFQVNAARMCKGHDGLRLLWYESEGKDGKGRGPYNAKNGNSSMDVKLRPKEWLDMGVLINMQKGGGKKKGGKLTGLGFAPGHRYDGHG